MSDWVEGRVARTLWRATDGDWAVLRIDDGALGFIVVGPLAGLADVVDDMGEGPFASFEGRFEQHASHGRRFKASAYLVGSPRTLDGLKQYLASSGVKGIGKVMARRIVDHFGHETTSMLEHTPERLAEIPGVGPKRAEAMAEAWAADAGARALGILLRSVGISGRLEHRIRDRYGDRAFSVVSKDPYRLARDIEGIGFLTADAVALRQGCPRDDPKRVAAAVVHLVKRATDDGHTLLPFEEIGRGLDRLSVPSASVRQVVDEAVAEGHLIVTGWQGREAITTPSLFAAASLVACALQERQASPVERPGTAEVVNAERLEGITLDDSQREAVMATLASETSVITGGPGTGKTTLVKVLLRVAADRGEVWRLASPTGRAARRLAEATGREASTLHRMLDYQPGSGFGRDENEPLETDGVVVDEASMVDIRLMAGLMRALPTDRRCRLILVGDADQLPSVGAGDVLRDVMGSGCVAVSRLEHVHRQAAKSGIVSSAVALQRGSVPRSGQTAGFDDFFLVERPQPEAALATLKEIVTKRLPARGLDIDDIQVLSPTRKGALGTRELNQMLREALRGDAPTVAYGARKFGIGDRVICTKNRYDHQVFNGDIGKVTTVSKSGVTIRFEDTTVVWAREELDQIELAYAITVHKSQGSEYAAVVLVLHRMHGIMLRRNLVYTALTRAKQFFCGVGESGAWGRAATRVDAGQRRTMLGAMCRDEDGF